MELRPIGRVRSSHVEQAGTPIQPAYGEGGETTIVEIDEPYRTALQDLDGFDRVWLITLLDRSKPFRTRVVPYRDTVERGLFATRAPGRPNPIGLSCMELRDVDIEAGVLTLGPGDLLDGTPVLDVKPYLPEVDAFPDARAGWFGASREARDKADDRFA
jgi:tRNA-Thr(GGU) m(6)t(6)A37 methyltransferase TsaA